MSNLPYAGIQRNNRSSVMIGFYYRLTNSEQFDKLVNNMSALDIAHLNVPEIRLNGKYNNSTYLWAKRNRLEAIERKIDNGSDLGEAKEALGIVGKGAKRDSGLRPELSRLYAKVRGKEQAKDYSDRLTDSDGFKKEINRHSLDYIAYGKDPYFNFLTNRVEAIDIKLGVTNLYSKKEKTNAENAASYLMQRIEAKRDTRLKKQLESIVEKYGLSLKTGDAEVIDMSEITKAISEHDQKPSVFDITGLVKDPRIAAVPCAKVDGSYLEVACGTPAGCYEIQDLIPILRYMSSYKNDNNQKILKRFYENYSGKPVKGANLNYSGRGVTTVQDIGKIRKIKNFIEKSTKDKKGITYRQVFNAFKNKYSREKVKLKDIREIYGILALSRKHQYSYKDILDVYKEKYVKRKEEVAGNTTGPVRRKQDKGWNNVYHAIAITISSIAIVLGWGGVAFEVRDYVLGKQAAALQAKARQLQVKGIYGDALKKANNARNKLMNLVFSKADNTSADGLINSIRKDIRLTDTANMLIGEARVLQKNKYYEGALALANEARKIYSQDSSKNNDNAADKLINEIQKDIETEKGKQNEVFFNKLSSDIQNGDLGAIAAGLVKFSELKKDYNAKNGFNGTASYINDEVACSNVEALINNTLKEVGDSVSGLIGSNGFIACNVSKQIQNLENARADVDLLKVLGKDLSAEYQQALQNAYGIRSDYCAAASVRHLLGIVRQKPDEIRESAKKARESLALDGFVQKEIYENPVYLSAIKKLGKENSLGNLKNSVSRHVRGQDPYWRFDISSELIEFLVKSRKVLGRGEEYWIVRAEAIDYIARSLEENYKPASLLKKFFNEFKIWEAIPFLAAITNPNPEGTIAEGIKHVLIPAKFGDKLERMVNGLAELRSGDGTNAFADVLFSAKEGAKLYTIGNTIFEVAEEGAKAGVTGGRDPRGGGDDTIIR